MNLIILPIGLPAVLNEQTNNLDVMMALAQVYEEMGEEEKAFDLVTHGRYTLKRGPSVTTVL
jgi:hypothetical protein